MAELKRSKGSQCLSHNSQILKALKNRVFFNKKKKVYDNTFATKPELNLGKTFYFLLIPLCVNIQTFCCRNTCVFDYGMLPRPLEVSCHRWNIHCITFLNFKNAQL